MAEVGIDTGDRDFVKIRPKTGRPAFAGVYNMPNREDFSQISECD